MLTSILTPILTDLLPNADALYAQNLEVGGQKWLGQTGWAKSGKSPSPAVASPKVSGPQVERPASQGNTSLHPPLPVSKLHNH